MVLSKTRNCSAGFAEVSTFGTCFVALLNNMLWVLHCSAPEQLQLTNAQVGMVLSKTRNCSAGFAEVFYVVFAGKKVPVFVALLNNL